MPTLNGCRCTFDTLVPIHQRINGIPPDFVSGGVFSLMERRWAKLVFEASTGWRPGSPKIPAGALVRVGNGVIFNQVHVFWGGLWASVPEAVVEYCAPPPSVWDRVLGDG